MENSIDCSDQQPKTKALPWLATGILCSSVLWIAPSYAFDAVFELSSLDGSNGFVVNSSFASFSDAGDINADGIDDFVLGNSGASPGGRVEAGET